MTVTVSQDCVMGKNQRQRKSEDLIRNPDAKVTNPTASWADDLVDEPKKLQRDATDGLTLRRIETSKIENRRVTALATTSAATAAVVIGERESGVGEKEGETDDGAARPLSSRLREITARFDQLTSTGMISVCV